MTLWKRTLRAGLLIGGLASATTAIADSPSHATRHPREVEEASVYAFYSPVADLSDEQRREFEIGRALFEVSWLPGPSPGQKDGLGPLLNARACNECHRRAGRGQARGPGWGGLPGTVVRIGIAVEDGPDRAHPLYGRQIQDRRLAGVEREAGIRVHVEPRTMGLDDGTARTLNRLRFDLNHPAYGPLGEDAVLGVRAAPALVGLGLLEAIPAEAIVARADPDDRDGDGVSGRVSTIESRSGAGSAEHRIGRFGWKATHPTLESQVAEAFGEDIGITSDRYPESRQPEAQRRKLSFASGGSPELSEDELRYTAHFVRSLAAPASRDQDDAIVRAGRTVFERLRCGECHTPEWTTGSASPIPQLAGRTIRPYTDLLLHDMGPSLAGGKRDGVASRREWRTPPLWGLGLHETVNGNTRLLHDGRARDVTEAILWHGGEALESRRRFQALGAEDRGALERFLRSL